MVRMEMVARVLQPWLGAAFLQASDVCARICGLLNGFDPAEGDFDALYRQTDSLLFAEIRALTREDMRVLLDDGRTMRVRVDDVDQMADEVLYLALHQLPHSAWHYGRLRQYAMTHDSLSALRALYQDFGAFQTADELELIARTARAAHPAYRWRAWLPEENR